MSCEIWIEAVSAVHDGEDPSVDQRLVRAHLERCATCRAFERDLAAFRRSPLYKESPPSTETIRHRVAAADRTSRPTITRALLAFVAVEMLVVSFQPVITGGDVGEASHPVRHIGAFTLAYAVAMLVTVVRPARAGAMFPVAIVLAGAVAANVAMDVVNGTASFASEWTHVPELFSVVLVWLLRRPRQRVTDVGGDDLPALELRPGSSLTWARLASLRRGRRDDIHNLRLAAGEEGT
jgi:predicted anti-sigma-YlaC factor YlaD